VRLDTKVGPRTRIEVVTDGLFLRMLQDDPSLDGIGCVIFDELHERGLETALSFALVREAQTALPDYARIPVVCLSGHHQARHQASTLGIKACVVKPFEIDDLLQVVNRFFPDEERV